MLTKRQAIRECKKLWHEIEDSGLSKKDFLLTKQGKIWSEKQYLYDCPLCEHNNFNYYSDCMRCPLVKQYPEYGDNTICEDFLGFTHDRKPTKKWLDFVYNLKE